MENEDCRCFQHSNVDALGFGSGQVPEQKKDPVTTAPKTAVRKHRVELELGWSGNHQTLNFARSC